MQLIFSSINWQTLHMTGTSICISYIFNVTLNLNNTTPTLHWRAHQRVHYSYPPLESSPESTLPESTLLLPSISRAHRRVHYSYPPFGELTREYTTPTLYWRAHQRVHFSHPPFGELTRGYTTSCIFNICFATKYRKHILFNQPSPHYQLPNMVHRKFTQNLLPPWKFYRIFFLSISPKQCSQLF